MECIKVLGVVQKSLKCLSTLLQQNAGGGGGGLEG